MRFLKGASQIPSPEGAFICSMDAFNARKILWHIR